MTSCHSFNFYTRKPGRHASQFSHCPTLPVQICEGAPDSTGRRQGPSVLLLYGTGAAGPDEFQRRLLHSCSCKRPGGVRSAAVRVLAGTSGPGGAAGGSAEDAGSTIPSPLDNSGSQLQTSLGVMVVYMCRNHLCVCLCACSCRAQLS